MIDLASAGIAANPKGAAEQRVACPQCGKGARDRALGINLEDGRFHCFRCGWKGRAGDSDSRYPPPRVARIDDPAAAERNRERLRQIWKDTLPLNHVNARAVRNYLESRALGEILQAPPVVLRAHRGLGYWDGAKSLGEYPAMVALFHGASGQPVTLHVTYLRMDGCTKASVASPKKIMAVPVRGATKGGAIHLYEPRAGILGIAEGIESALSMHLLQKLPVWSAFCADNLERAHLPKNLRELHIGVDVDSSGKGEQVAQALAKRIRRLSPQTKVYTVTPEVDGTGDLNDELRRRKYGRR
jgi:putative DNA primase/helicase